MDALRAGGDAPTVPATASRRLADWVCNTNPFYPISAALVLLGLRMSLAAGAGPGATAATVAGLAAYTLLLAATACVLVRLGNVWEDVRTILLLVVLAFLSMSVIFDDVLAADPALGAACDLGGLLFAVGVSEALLRTMRLRLPAGYRLPYYLMLALFFLYPIGLSRLGADSGDPALLWTLYGFAPLAGLAFLTLLPAIRRGPGYVDGNGGPWRWPLYPWVLFLMIAVGVVGRSYYSCLSANYAAGPGQYVNVYSSIFGPYFLAPFGLALAALLLEAAIVAGHPGLMRFAVRLPLALVLLGLLGHRPDPVYRRFLGLFESTLGGSPAYVALLAALGFAIYARLRRVPGATGAACGALLGLAVVGPSTRDLDGLVAPRALPILALGLVQLVGAIRRPDAWRSLKASACLATAAALALPPGYSAEARGLVGLHLAVGTALAIGALFDDALARRLRDAAAVGLALLCLAGSALGPGWLGDVPRLALVAYPPALIALAAAYGIVLDHRPSRTAALAGLGGWLGLAGWRIYADLRRQFVGLDHVVLGLLSFAVAALVSLKKAGVLRRQTKPGGLEL